MFRRTNEQWIPGLCGADDDSEQRRAHEDLARYLHKVVYNYLLRRQSNLLALRDFAPEELGELAQDFVQETLEKLARDNFSLFETFDGRGAFTSWAARIVINQARQELRRAYWTRRAAVTVWANADPETQSSSIEHLFVSLEPGPEAVAIRNDLLWRVSQALQCCLERLRKERCIAYWRCEVEGRAAQEVAQELNITTNAVFLHVFRAKHDLRKCLEKASLDREILDVFEQ